MENEKRDIKAVNEFLKGWGGKDIKSSSPLKPGDMVRCKGFHGDYFMAYDHHIGKTFRVEDKWPDKPCFRFTDIETNHELWDSEWMCDPYFELIAET